MGKFGSYENYYDPLIWGAAQRHTLGGWNAQATAALIKAHIAQESYPPFNWQSVRREPGGNDSIGLMQVLRSNARDLSADQLMDPATNIDRGAALIEQNWRRSNGDLDAAISAYNGGWSKSAAMGYRATVPVTVCLARDVNGVCIRTRTAQPGEFGNQPYVDSVKANFSYFLGQSLNLPDSPPDQLKASQPPLTLRGDAPVPAVAEDFPVAAVAGIGGGVALLLAIAYFLLRNR